MKCSCGNVNHGERVSPSRIVTIIEKKPVVLLYQAGMDALTGLCWFCSFPESGRL